MRWLEERVVTSSNETTIGIKGTVAAAKILALTGTDILADPEFRKQMKADFDKRTEGFVCKPPIPEMIKEPVGLPDEMRHFVTLLELKESYIKSGADDQLMEDSRSRGKALWAVLLGGTGNPLVNLSAVTDRGNLRLIMKDRKIYKDTVK